MKYKIARISFKILEKLIKGEEFKKAQTNLPNDVKIKDIRRLTSNFSNNQFELLLESEYFDEVKDGEVIPVTEIVLTTINTSV